MFAVLGVAAEVRSDLAERVQAPVAVEVVHSGSPDYACYIVLVGIHQAQDKSVHIVDLQVGSDEHSCLQTLVHGFREIL